MKLESITMANVDAACALDVRPEQRNFVAPVVRSLADAYAAGPSAWPRLVLDGDEPVAFVMAGFDPDAELDFFRCGVWRLNVAADRQGRGYGRFAVDAVAAEARSRGSSRMTVLWLPGEAGPEGFYLRYGFRPTGQEFHGQLVGEFLLD